MNQKKPAREPLDVKKAIILIAAITAGVLLILKVIKETTRVRAPIPLMTPLPGAQEDSSHKTFGNQTDAQDQTE